RLGGVGQRDQQGVIAPGAVVGDIDALLALGVGADERTVDVEHSLVKERAGLLSPDALAGAGEGVHQIQDIATAATATEVARGAGVGDALGIQGLEIGLVGAEPSQMVQPGAPGQEVQGDVQDRVGLVVGEMALEQMQIVIDVGNQSGPACQQEHSANAAWTQPLDPITQFVMNVVSGDHGLLALGTGAVFDAAEGSPLASSQLVQDMRFHSKASVAWPNEDMWPPLLLPNHWGFSSFFR